MSRIIQAGQQVKGSQIDQKKRKEAQKGTNVPKKAKGN